jgi:lysozyme family protein
MLKIRYILLFFVIGISGYHLIKTKKEPRVQDFIPLGIQQPFLPLQNDRFKKAFQNLLKEEGGYVNDKKDRGGETKYGVSKRSYPQVDIKNLTLEQASLIYHRDFYLPMRCDKFVDDAVAVEVLEQSVNIGKKTVIFFIQIVAAAHGENITMDGYMGDKTVQAANRIPPSSLLTCLKSLAIAHYMELVKENPPMGRYLKGWIKRVTT